MVHGVTGLLLTAVAGYWVLERAETHKGSVKRIGQLLGAITIIVSFVGLACEVSSPAGSGMRKGGWCPFSRPSNPSPR